MRLLLDVIAPGDPSLKAGIPGETIALAVVVVIVVVAVIALRRTRKK